jgi:all-trans-retinol dehydrogenase (NAD+)
MNNLIDNTRYEKADNFEIKDYQSLTRQIYFIFVTSFMLVQELLLYLKDFFSPPKPEQIAGQVCLVTGGANGLGRCLALKFAEQKCKIVIADILDTDSTVNEIKEKYGVECKGMKCDISDFDALEKLKKDIEASVGPVDILVNNAGLLFSGTLDSYSLKSIEKCVAVNLTSHFMVSQLKQLEGFGVISSNR